MEENVAHRPLLVCVCVCFQRLNQPANRHRWSMSVMSVNSYYDNAVNGLFITAGMLQRPFFDAAWDMSRNFGAHSERERQRERERERERAHF